jgi:hypothetical protein
MLFPESFKSLDLTAGGPCYFGIGTGFCEIPTKHFIISSILIEDFFKQICDYLRGGLILMPTVHETLFKFFDIASTLRAVAPLLFEFLE